MKEVEFDYVGRDDGLTIYHRCFSIYRMLNIEDTLVPEKIVKDTEKVFHFLIQEGEKYWGKRRDELNLGSILEIPDSIGSTCFSIASHCSSESWKSIMESIIKRGI